MYMIYVHNYHAEAISEVVLCVVVFLQDGHTALMIAADEGHESIVERLLAAGANIDLQDQVSTL